jgi:hypothetical protein
MSKALPRAGAPASSYLAKTADSLVHSCADMIYCNLEKLTAKSASTLPACLLLLSCRYPELGDGAILEISRCWPTGVINFLSSSHLGLSLILAGQSHFCNILEAPARQRPPRPIGQWVPTPWPCSLQRLLELGSAHSRCESGVSFQMSERGCSAKDQALRLLEQNGDLHQTSGSGRNPRVVSVRSQRGLILCRGPAEP